MSTPEIYTEADIERFHKYFVVGGPDDCWNWTGNHNGKMNRASFSFDGHMMLAARFAFYIATGIWPGEWMVCHTCDNALCVNPKHLWLGTQKENMRDMVVKGRAAQGAANGSAKLTEDDVREIRSKYHTGKWTQKQLAEEYSTNQVHIGEIVNRKNWRHIT